MSAPVMVGRVGTVYALAMIAALGGTCAHRSESVDHLPPPLCASLFPCTGPPSGGQMVTITGQFHPGPPPPEVWFIGATGQGQAAVVSATGTTITAITPPGCAGELQDVSVTDASGFSCTCLACYSYRGCADSVAPGSGGTNGGNLVTITGTDFHTLINLEILFGDYFIDPTKLTMNFSGTIMIMPAPPSPTGGTVPVDIRHLPGGEPCTVACAYTYVPPGTSPCTVSDITPADGPLAGGQMVTITGSGFDADTGVLFGRRPAASVNFISSSTIEAVTPEGDASTTAVDVVVAPANRDPCTVPAAYTYY